MTNDRITSWGKFGRQNLRPVNRVQEYEILRIAAALSINDVQVAALVREEVLRWAQKRSGGSLPDNAWQCQTFEYFSGGRNSIGIRMTDANTDIWALRAEDPDKTVAGRIWTTEVVVGTINNQPPRFSARLLVSTAESELDIEPHTPGFVLQITQVCDLFSGPYQLTSEPELIRSSDDLELLIEKLLDQNRKFPVFVLTVPEGAPSAFASLIDASSLSRAILGIGQVVILPSAFTWRLTERLGKKLSVFGGAVRAYLPGFTDFADPYRHRLIFPAQLSPGDGVGQCMRWARSIAASESMRNAVLGQDVLSFAEIRRASLLFEQQKLEQGGASDSELLAASKARIDALESEIAQNQATLEYFDQEHKRAEARAESAEEQARASAFRIQQLLTQLKDSGGEPDDNIELPSSWQEFANWCDTNLAGRVVLSPQARRSIKAAEYEDVSLAARCLLWLANDCRERRIQGGDGSLREESVADGMRNAHCGEDQFDLNWQGQRYTADWHIKSGGNTRDPKRCLRIYYFWDTATLQIIVAQMPEHRRTDAT